MRALSKLMFAGFGLTIAALAVASWDVARGRAPDTASLLMLDALAGGDNRTCTRDASALVQRHVPPGLPAAEAEARLRAATIALPRAWFWTPASQDALEASETGLVFTRTVRASPFGNQLLRGLVVLEAGQVARVEARMICPFG
jgi:hypothetical protein